MIKSSAILFLSLCILISGAYLENKFGDQHFQRSGSIVVVIAVLHEIRLSNKFLATLLLSFSIFSKSINSTRLITKAIINTIGGAFSGKDFEQVVPASLWGKLEKDELDIESKKKTVANDFSDFDRTSKFTALSALIGTIVWGYGDLISGYIGRLIFNT